VQVYYHPELIFSHLESWRSPSRWTVALVLLLISQLGIRAAYAGPIYVVREAGGVIRFTNKSPGAGTNAKVFNGKKAAFSVVRRGAYFSPRARFRPLNSKELDPLITSAALRHKLDSELVRAVIHAESAFNPYAVSPKGALGLMQLMPDTARMLGVDRPFEAKDNIEGGTKYLSSLYYSFNGNVKLALAAYNAGPGAVERYKGIPPYSETIEYVDRVLELKKQYQAQSKE